MSEATGASALGPRSALALCGFSAVVGQIVLMRELIQVFNGNEIALGILLATWLLWTAAGSGLWSVLTAAAGRGLRRPRLAVAALECLLAASLPAAVWALRGAKAFFQTVPGELVGPVPMLLTSLVCLSVFCAASGALFVAAARMAEAESGLSARAAAGAAYLLEAAGSGLGGILASVLLVRYLDAFQIAAIVGLLNLCVAIALLLRLRRAPLVLLACAAALAAVPLLAWVAPRWDAAARARLWQGFHVVAARDSIYGALTVTETGEGEGGTIRSLYENGAILANAPDPAAAEEAVNYALLEHAAPRRVLLIGGGVNGGVAEALKHPTVASLDYVELDPALIGMARQYFPAQTADFDSDPRVHLHFLDGRRYLAETGAKFDAILVDVPDPQTAQLNRFYTAEFFRLARAHLEPGGLLALQLRSSEETISPDLAAFLQSIRRTLGEVFPYQAAIPGETIHFFGAMQSGVLTSDPQVLVARLRERKLNTQYVREYFIPYRMMPDRMEQVETDLAPSAATPVNRDFAPIAYAFDVVLWSAQFRSGYAGWFRAAEHIAFNKVAGTLGIALLVGAGLLAILPGRERRKRAAAGSCVAATGFTLIALEDFSAARISGGVRVRVHRAGDPDRAVDGGHCAGQLAGDAARRRSERLADGAGAASARDCGAGAAACGQFAREFFLDGGRVDCCAGDFSSAGGAGGGAGRVSIRRRGGDLFARSWRTLGAGRALCHRSAGRMRRRAGAKHVPDPRVWLLEDGVAGRSDQCGGVAAGGAGGTDRPESRKETRGSRRRCSRFSRHFTSKDKQG